MTAKEKAQELVNGFRKYASGDDEDGRFSLAIEKENAKLCAVLSVNGLGDTIFSKEYWQEVKQEIEKL